MQSSTTTYNVASYFFVILQLSLEIDERIPTRLSRQLAGKILTPQGIMQSVAFCP